MNRILIALLGGLLVCACSPEPGKTPKIAEDQLKAMEQARALQDTLQQQADRRREQIDEQGK